MLVLEKTEWLGSATAYSAGTAWIPGHRHQPDPAADTEQPAATSALIGDRAPRALRESYLARPRMLDYLENKLGVGFWPPRRSSTTTPNSLATASAAPSNPAPSTARTGITRFGRIRRPVPSSPCSRGTLMVRRAEVNQLLTLFHGSPRGLASPCASVSAGPVTGSWAGHAAPAGHGQRPGRPPHRQLLRRRSAVWFTADTTELVTDDAGRVTGAVVSAPGPHRPGRRAQGRCWRRGGFSASPELRATHLPRPARQFTRAAGAPPATRSPSPARSAAPSATPATTTPCGFPSSVGRRRDGTTAVFPHLGPGQTRHRRGRRGGAPVRRQIRLHHRFVRAMYDAHKSA